MFFDRNVSETPYLCPSCLGGRLKPARASNTLQQYERGVATFCLDPNLFMIQVIILFMPAGREMCDAPPDKELFQRCNLVPCETFQFSVSSWSACSQSCGGGYRTRKMTCLSSFGHVVNPAKCTCTGTDCDTFEECNTNDCDGPYLTFSTYSACNVVCGGGVKTRTANCNLADGTAADETVCLELGLQDTAAEVPCNTAACRADSFIWKTGTWSACDSAACGGTRTREVTCVYVPVVDTRFRVFSNMQWHLQSFVACDNLASVCRNAYTGVTASTDTACAGMKPDIEQSCEPCSFCEDPLLNENCSGRGQCVNDACDCDGVWGGAICAIDTTLCAPPGRLDPDGNCCASGVLSSTGSCCEVSQAGTDPVLDGDGNCCSAGFFDACGICGANNIGIDVFGICCPVRSASTTRVYHVVSTGAADVHSICRKAAYLTHRQDAVHLATWMLVESAMVQVTAAKPMRSLTQQQFSQRPGGANCCRQAVTNWKHSLPAS